MTSYMELMAAIDEVGETPCMSAPNFFFAEDDGDWSSKMLATQNARQLCRMCPIRLQCLDYALTNGEWDGVWGGMSPGERKVLVRGRVA